MAQLLPRPPAPAPVPEYERGTPAAGRTPVTMWVDGDPVHGTLYEPTPEAAQGRRIGGSSWSRSAGIAGTTAGAAPHRRRLLRAHLRLPRPRRERGRRRRRYVPAPPRARYDGRRYAPGARDVPRSRAPGPLVGYAYCQAVTYWPAAPSSAISTAWSAWARRSSTTTSARATGACSRACRTSARCPSSTCFEFLTDYDGTILFIYGEGDLFQPPPRCRTCSSRARHGNARAPGAALRCRPSRTPTTLSAPAPPKVSLSSKRYCGWTGASAEVTRIPGRASRPA